MGKRYLAVFMLFAAGAVLTVPAAPAHAANALVGAAGGFASGVASAVTRTLSGLWDVVTFALPPYDKAIVQPETLFERRYRSLIN